MLFVTRQGYEQIFRAPARERRPDFVSSVPGVQTRPRGGDRREHWCARVVAVLDAGCGIGRPGAGRGELHREEQGARRVGGGYPGWATARECGLMARFSERMDTEVVQRFWAAMARGEFIADAAAEAGTYRKKGARWLAACGGVRPRRGRDLKGRCLTFAEREEIALARAGGQSMRAIAAQLGRSPSTISRELARNTGAAGQAYRARTAHALAYERSGRPKPSKLAVNLALGGPT